MAELVGATGLSPVDHTVVRVRVSLGVHKVLCGGIGLGCRPSIFKKLYLRYRGYCGQLCEVAHLQDTGKFQIPAPKERVGSNPTLAPLFINPLHPANPLTGETTIKNSQQR